MAAVAQADLCEFEVHLAYRVRSRKAMATQKNLVSETQNKTKQKSNNFKVP